MGWKIRITEKARKDHRRLNGAIRKQALASVYKVSQAPLSSPHGYRKPLGNKGGNNLTGFLKIKHRGVGARVIYILLVDETVVNIVIISERDDNYCYNLASALYKRYGRGLSTNIFEGSDNGEQNGEQ